MTSASTSLHASASLLLGGRQGLGLISLTNIDTVADATVAHRDGRWWMAIGGMAGQSREVGLYSAMLPVGAPLDSTEWTFVSEADEPSRARPLAPAPLPGSWDTTGYHCASYARGQDQAGNVVERLYYASAESWENITGPYRIGVLQWDGHTWVRHAEPVFTAASSWERGTVLEPNVVYDNGLWTLYYTAGLGADHPCTGVAVSEDGLSGWRRVGEPGADQFDALPLHVGNGYGRVVARYRFGAPATTDGLWWSRIDRLDDPWSSGRLILSSADGTTWHNAGVWKPTAGLDRGNLVVFFNAAERTEQRGLGALAIGRLTLPLPAAD